MSDFRELCLRTAMQMTMTKMTIRTSNRSTAAPETAAGRTTSTETAGEGPVRDWDGDKPGSEVFELIDVTLVPIRGKQRVGCYTWLNTQSARTNSKMGTDTFTATYPQCVH